MAAEPAPSGFAAAEKLTYMKAANSLQHLLIYRLTDAPTSHGIWVVYIHGGAWRDPRITAATVEPALTYLSNELQHSAKGLCGVASVSYSLSAHPQFPNEAGDEAGSNTAVHPQHLNDVVAAIEYLSGYVMGGNEWVLVGHSAGATLAWQAVEVLAKKRHALSKAHNAESADQVVLPAAIVGVAGLYDLDLLVTNPGGPHDAYKQAYHEIVEGAFGTDRTTWRAASPTTVVRAWGADQTPNLGQLVRRPAAMLAYSADDSLVPRSQSEAMQTALADDADDKLAVVAMHGDHDECWASGGELARVILAGLEFAENASQHDKTHQRIT